MNFIDLFAGIGGFRSGLEMNGHKCLAYAEIDKYARQSYKAIYDTNGEEEWEDVTKITNEEFRKYRGSADIIVGGFPCQAFSVAGKRRGFEDTRGTLFFEVARAIKEIQPHYALLENVKGLLSHDKGRTFGTIIQTLDELGYIVEWGLFNSKFWGVPQNRERVYILVTRKDIWNKPIIFDLLKNQLEVSVKLLDILEDEVDEKFYLSLNSLEKLIETNESNDLKVKVKEATKKGFAEANIGDSINVTFPESQTRRGRVGKQIANTLQAGEVNQAILTLKNKDCFGRFGEQAISTYNDNLEKVNKGNTINAYNKTIDNSGVAPTLTTRPEGFKTAILPISNDLRIRKLTPLECWRLQGFKDEQFYAAQNSGVSNAQLYKQAGNSVTINVIDAIIKELNIN